MTALRGRKPKWPGGKKHEFRPHVTIDNVMFDVLDKAAKKRGVSQAQIAALILMAVLNDDIVDAVIDDEALA